MAVRDPDVTEAAYSSNPEHFTSWFVQGRKMKRKTPAVGANKVCFMRLEYAYYAQCTSLTPLNCKKANIICPLHPFFSRPATRTFLLLSETVTMHICIATVAAVLICRHHILPAASAHPLIPPPAAPQSQATQPKQGELRPQVDAGHPSLPTPLLLAERSDELARGDGGGRHRPQGMELLRDFIRANPVPSAALAALSALTAGAVGAEPFRPESRQRAAQARAAATAAARAQFEDALWDRLSAVPHKTKQCFFERLTAEMVARVRGPHPYFFSLFDLGVFFFIFASLAIFFPTPPF